MKDVLKLTGFSLLLFPILNALIHKDFKRFDDPVVIGLTILALVFAFEEREPRL